MAKGWLVTLLAITRYFSTEAVAPYFSETKGYVNGAGGGTVKHRGEYFEISTPPFSVQYGQVFWKMSNVDLPDDIVRRFDGKVIAITGFENQVVRVDSRGEELAVPCSDLYNHHWNLYLTSSKAPMNEAEQAAAHNRSHGGFGRMTGPLDPPQPGAPPVRQVFSEANGNEHRGSFHGTPAGYAQLLDSPRHANLLHMSINTRHPEGTRLDPQLAPQPRSSNARLPAAERGWSGLLECPCTTRRKFDVDAGTIDGKRFFDGCVPGGALERMNNTICSVDTYRGGTQCCADGVILLDADQQVNSSDTYVHKLRIYYEEPTPVTRNAFRLYWQTEEWQGEYDIPQCAAGTPPELCVHTMTTAFRAVDLFGGLTSPVDPQRLNCTLYSDVWCGQVQDVEAAGGKFKLLNMGFHQHSPAVISGELINADTGELICRSVPTIGQTVGEPFDELGYAFAIPPCVWGSAHENLPQPPVLSLSTNLLAIAKYNSSVQHYGVMAMWQGRGGLL